MVISNRTFFAFSGIGVISLLCYGYYLEYFEDLVPCPMCIFQRLCYMAIAAVALAAVIQGPARRGGIVYCTLLAVFASIGAGIAGRHQRPLILHQFLSTRTTWRHRHIRILKSLRSPCVST